MAAVPEIPETAPQKPLGRHYAVFREVEIDADKPDVVEFAAGIDDRQSRRRQRFNDISVRHVYNDTVAVAEKGLVSHVVGLYGQHGDAVPFLRVSGDAGQKKELERRNRRTYERDRLYLP